MWVTWNWRGERGDVKGIFLASVGTWQGGRETERVGQSKVLPRVWSKWGTTPPVDTFDDLELTRVR